MWIETKIPYAYNRTLADIYNRAMSTSEADWILLLDHDVFLASNPHWYEILLEGIKQVDTDKTGLITCVTSGRKGFPQDDGISEEKTINPDIKVHLQKAKWLYRKYGVQLREIRSYRHIGGFFMLVNKSVWKKVKFSSKISNNGIDKIDRDYCERLLNNGYKIYVMPGLYVYHMRYRWSMEKEIKKKTNHGKAN